MQPIIALTTSGRHEKNFKTPHYDAYYHIPAPYVDAVRRAGGVPVLVPPGEPGWQDVLQRVDGIIVTGGSDIHPRNYAGNDQHPNLTETDAERDQSEIELVRHITATDQWPVLCICRGMQMLNVALGGSLYEHIPDMRPVDMHRGPDGGWALQQVNVKPGSRLEQIMGTTEVHTYSGHHQAAKTVAAGLQVTATSPDDVVEALEMPDHPWLVAVQWHPEVSAAQDPTQQALFDALVGAAVKSALPG
jgi:putative glutamine amidotransferase